MRVPRDTEDDLVRRVQEVLTETGHEVAEATGVFDEETRRRLADFQLEQGLDALGEITEDTLAELGIDVGAAEQELPQVEDERERFRHYLAKNPNYFGNQPAVDAEAVEVIETNTAYEELECVGYEPDNEQLEAVVHVKRSVGYLGGICSSGSPEYVRFYLDEDNSGTWTDLGMANFTAYDIPGEKPLEYGVSLQIDPDEAFCFEENLPRVRAILSWNQAPPADTPNFTPVWGNVLDARIQIDPVREFVIGDLTDQFDVQIPEPLLAGIDTAQPLSFEPPSLSGSDIAETYVDTSVPAHRFGYPQLLTALEEPAVGDLIEGPAAFDPVSGADLDLDFDPEDIIGDLQETVGDTYYEELHCVGYTNRGLNAVLTLNRPNGYSGGLCSAGSNEFVAFWEWDPNASRWNHLGTSAVNVHDIQGMPNDGLQYAVFLPASLGHRQQPCGDGASIVKIRATLSWERPPPAGDPYWEPTWGNSLETLVHVPPGPSTDPGEPQGFIDTVGSMAPCDIDQPSGRANGPDSSTLGGFTAKQSPFGGTVVVTGRILNPPPALATGVDPIQYRVLVRPLDAAGTSPTGPWRPVLSSPTVRVREKTGSGLPTSYRTSLEPDDQGFYDYLVDEPPEPWRYVISDVLTEWHTGDLEGKWELKLQTKLPGEDPVAAHPVSCAEGGTRSSVVLQLDNTRPEAEMAITEVVPQGSSTAKTANECGKIQRSPGAEASFPVVGDTIKGRYEAWDDNILSFNFALAPNAQVHGASIVPNHKQFALSETGESGTWTLDTSPMDSCGFVGRIHVEDRTIVNSRHLGWGAGDNVGFCLEEPIETDG